MVPTQGKALVSATVGVMGKGEEEMVLLSARLLPQWLLAVQIKMALPVPNVTLMAAVVLEPDQPVPMTAHE